MGYTRSYLRDHHLLGRKGKRSSRKALTEVKENTRTLAMVLRSERELLSLNKEQKHQIQEIKLLLEEKNQEVEKLKDLSLKQREDIKSLKNAVLFPDVTNSQLQDLLEKQGEGEQIFTSGDHFSSPRTPSYDQDETANYLFDQEFSSGDYTTTQSLDDMFLKDINPCLTPCYSKTKSKEFGITDFPECSLSKHKVQTSHQTGFVTCATKLSKSSECRQTSKAGNGLIRTARRSDESKTGFMGNKCIINFFDQILQNFGGAIQYAPGIVSCFKLRDLLHIGRI